MSACRSCSAPIIWAEHHVTGRRMPLNRSSVDMQTTGAFTVMGGTAYPLNVAVEKRALDNGVSEARARELLEERDWHVSHFATCPQASAHRRPR